MEYRQGKKFDPRTARMVDELVRTFGPIIIVQGSYGEGGNSAGTHMGGGAIDVSDNGMGSTQIARFIRTARTQGWAMWHRPDRPGVWSSHFHGIAIQPGGKGDRGVLSTSAHAQVIDYYEGRDGLAGDGPDPHAGFGIKPTTFERYQATLTTPYPLTWPKRFGWKAGARLSWKPLLVDYGTHVRKINASFGFNATPYYTENTMRAVMAWERNVGLDVTGMIDKRRWERRRL
jgi:hypothetical protein